MEKVVCKLCVFFFVYQKIFECFFTGFLNYYYWINLFSNFLFEFKLRRWKYLKTKISYQNMSLSNLQEHFIRKSKKSIQYSIYLLKSNQTFNPSNSQNMTHTSIKKKQTKQTKEDIFLSSLRKLIIYLSFTGLFNFIRNNIIKAWAIR